MAHRSPQPRSPHSMQAPPFPPDEAFRLQALRSLCILDTPSEERFDRITRSAAYLFKVPIALVSLVDAGRQWFKSKVGLEAQETSREVSFCGHAILARELFVVENALLDPRFADNPLVTGAPFIRFYAGMPLRGPGNALLGTLCLIDREPRAFSRADRDSLQDLGGWAERELSQMALQEALSQAAEGEIFFHLSPDLACIVGLDGHLLKVNPAMAGTLGFPETELLTRPFLDFVHPEDAAKAALLLRAPPGEDPHRQTELRARRKDGRELVLAWAFARHEGAVYAAARDITDLRISQETRRRLKAVLDRSPDFIGVSDAEGHPLYWNAAYRRLRGLGPVEPIPEGLHVKDTHVEWSARQLLDTGLPTAVARGVWEGESCYRDPEGGEIPVSQVLMAHRDPSGRVQFLSSIARDISTYRIHDEALKAGHRLLAQALADLRASEARYRVLVEASPDLIARHGPDGRFMDINPAVTRVLGFDRDEIVGHSPAEFVQEADLEPMLDFFRDLRAGKGRGTVRFRVRHKAGREVWLESRGERLAIEDGRVTEVVIASRDVTEQLELERLKALFLSTASHELRTPLASIRASLEMLAEGRGGALPPKAADLAAVAHANAVRLARIVDDMLDLDRVKQGRMTFTLQRCHLHVLARQAVEAVQTFGDAFGVALPCGPWPEDAEVIADPDRVVQILVNLLSNATKYSPAGGPVTTRIAAAGKGWSVEVEDRGPGIPETFQSRIFESFAQAGGPQQQPGSGLGLSISKSFAEAMGGGLDFESRPGRTVFRLQLPAAGTAPAAAGTALPSILHVEDDAAVSQLLATSLEGVAVLVNVSSLAQAELRLADAAWALVVLDSHLPDGEGLSLLPRLRELRGPGLPVLLFTGEDTFPGMAGDIAYVFLKGSVGPGEIRWVIQGFLAER